MKTDTGMHHFGLSHLFLRLIQPKTRLLSHQTWKPPLAHKPSIPSQIPQSQNPHPTTETNSTVVAAPSSQTHGFLANPSVANPHPTTEINSKAVTSPQTTTVVASPQIQPTTVNASVFLGSQYPTDDMNPHFQTTPLTFTVPELSSTLPCRREESRNLLHQTPQ